MVSNRRIHVFQKLVKLLQHKRTEDDDSVRRPSTRRKAIMTRLGAIVEVHVADRGRDRRRGLGLVYARRYVQLDPVLQSPGRWINLHFNEMWLILSDVSRHGSRLKAG